MSKPTTNSARLFLQRLAAATLAVVAAVGLLEFLSWPTTESDVASSAGQNGVTPSVAPLPAAPEDPLFGASHYDIDLVPQADRELVSYGKEIVEHTDRVLGPLARDAGKRFSGSGLTCKNCHLEAGLKQFAAPYVGVTKRYPNFRNRENSMGTIEQRVNGCMERSMNGRPLALDSREMLAIVAYMTWLGHQTDEKGTVPQKEFISAKYPNRGVDLERGREVYTKDCVVCHGTEGLGKKDPSGHGYQFPPVAGDESYNTGAGMHRVLTAMAFIQGNMPLGVTADNPILSDDDAFDVAGYINSLPRPEKAELDDDYPERSLKPMSTPYGPYADPFSEVQHKYGPFPPIYAYYESKFQLKKKN